MSADGGIDLRKWLKTTMLAEMSHADSCNFFRDVRFQSVGGGSDARAKKLRTARLADDE